MPTADELAVEILSKARSVASGSRRIDQHDLNGVATLLKALRDEDSASATAAALPARGLRLTKLVSPGCGG